MSSDQPFNIWTSLYNFYTKTVPALVTPGSTIGVLTGKTPISGTQPPAPPDANATSAFSVDFISKLEDMAKNDPRGLAKIFTELYTAAGVTLGILSLIPTESNFGGPLAARIFHDLLSPIVRKVYTGPAELYLDQFFPTNPISPRLLVSGVEAGAFEEDQLLEQLTEAGTTDKGIAAALAVARVKRFDVETKDDLALIKTYQNDLIKLQVANVQDVEKATIADLKSRRAALVTELKGVLAASG